MELPGASLQKACRLLVVFCALHLSAVLFYYLRGNTLSHQRSPEPPPRSQTFGRRVTEADLSGNISKPAADCPDPSPLLSKCGAPRAPSLSAPSPKSSTVGSPRFSPSPAFASPRGSPQFQPAALCLSLLEASLTRCPIAPRCLSPHFIPPPFPVPVSFGPCLPPLKSRSLALFLRDLPAATPFPLGSAGPARSGEVSRTAWSALPSRVQPTWLCRLREKEKESCPSRLGPFPLAQMSVLRRTAVPKVETELISQ